MLHDEYFMNKITGELMTGTAAIKEFYKTHGALERWADEWMPTGMEADEILDAPNFTGAVNV